MTDPSGRNCDPWHGQSQQVSSGFQCTMQPTWVQVADRWSSFPSLSRYAATFFAALADDRALAWIQVVNRRNVAAGHIFG